MRDYRNEPVRNPVKQLAETGALLALMMLLIMAGVMMPVFGGFALFVQPSILYLIAVRSGARWAVMATMAATALTLMLLGPIEMLGVLLIQLLPALVFSLLLSRRIEIGWLMFGTTLAYFVGMLCWFMIGMSFLGLSLAPDVIEVQMRATLDASTLFANFSSEDIEKVKESLPYYARLAYGFAAVVLLLSSLGSSFINYKVTEFISRRFTKEKLPSFPFFSLWRFPQWVGMPLVILYICNIYIHFQGLIVPDWMLNIAAFFLYVSGFAMLLQGLSVFKFMLDRYNISRLVFFVLIIVMLVVQLLLLMAVFVGVADLFLNYRRLSKK